MESPSGESYNGLHDLTNTQPPSPSIRSISAALAASILCSPDLKDPLPDHVSIISLHNTTIPDDVDPASIPLPSSPRPRQLQHTVSGFSLRVRELHDVGDATSLKVAEPPRASTPTTMVDQMLSVFMAACSLKDDKKPRPKKKGGLEGADGPATSILKDNREPKNKKRPQDIADGVAPLRMSKTYRLASPWKKQKDAGKYQTPSPVQNKDLLAFFHEVVEKDHPEERNMSELPDMVQITLKIASGTKVCWASLNTVDTWAVSTLCFGINLHC